MGYEVIDISGDAGIRATGADLRELFESAAMGMYSLITDVAHVAGKKEIKISLESHSVESLLVAWLNELIYYLDARGFIGGSVSIKEFASALESARLSATVKGEDFDPARHEKGLLVKAATFHNLKVKKEGGLWHAEIIFDI